MDCRAGRDECRCLRWRGGSSRRRRGAFARRARDRRRRAARRADAPQWSIDKSPLQGVEQTAPAHVLVFTETAAFRHTDAITNGTPLLRAALEQAGVTSEHTEDSSIFNDTDLARFDALVMFQTSGDPWTASEKAALEKYQRAGGGIVAIHNATDMRGNYQWWDDLVGTLMPGHAATGNSPGLQGQVIVEDKAHPSTKHLPGTPLDALGRVVQLLDQRPGQRARAAHDGRVVLRPGRQPDGLRPSDLVVQALRRRPCLGHRHGPLRRALHRARAAGAHRRRRQVGGGRGARRLRRHDQLELREGRARREHERAVRARRRPRRARLLHRARARPDPHLRPAARATSRPASRSTSTRAARTA